MSQITEMLTVAIAARKDSLKAIHGRSSFLTSREAAEKYVADQWPLFAAELTEGEK
jgi:hypothetical protein